jgi:hypothetical protein
MDYRKHLNDLKSKLARKQMSLLVGSGFSKNVSLKFPSWEELLYDLICGLYKEEFHVSYLKKVKDEGTTMDETEFLKQKCKDIIAKRGYLDIVSDFVKQGSAEDITTYIEERTPYITYNDKRLTLEIKGQTEELNPESLSLHRTILELPWNNVYTTNYDQLLDLCVNENQFQELSDEIEALEKDKQALYLQLDENREEFTRQGRAEQAIVDNTSNDPEGIASGLTLDQDKSAKSKKDLEKEANDFLNTISEKDKLIGAKEKAQSNCFNVVRKATDLQLKRTSNIIKLHGSLRTKEQRENYHFGFDGDLRKHYIISREHYDSYPKQHEPFTQLMRISLLQESFCLVGFSGDDPNFLAWVDWVRDVIQRDRSQFQRSKGYKIYLIDVNAGELSPAKQLFFENYNILRIPLLSPEVITVINSGKPLPAGKEEIKLAIQLFLSYLGDHDKISLMVPVTDLSFFNEWSAVWKKLNFYTLDLWESAELINESVEKLNKLRGTMVIPNLKDRYTENQERLLHLIKHGRKWHERVYDSTKLSLLLHAIQDSFLPIDYAVDQVYITKLLEDPATGTKAKDLVNTTESMHARLPLGSGSEFQKALSLAFSFRFNDLIIHLRNWQPIPCELMKKAGFLSFLSPSEAEELLETELRNFEDYSAEERLYIYELLAFIKMTRFWSRDVKLDKLISGFKQSGFTSVEDNLRVLYEAMDDKPSKPEPRGDGRYSVSRFQEFEEHPKTRLALKFLMLLVQSGFQLNLRRATRMSVAEWYKIINKGFEYYPSAFLFYGLQLDDPDYLKRLGQDYASSSKIKPCQLNGIANNLLASVTTAHHGYQKNIYVFLSTMMISVDPKIWELHFMDIWREGVVDASVFAEKHSNSLRPFVIFALRYINKTANLLEVLKDCLQAVLSGDKSVVVDYLYYLNRNVHFKRIERSGFEEFVIDEIIDQVVDGLTLSTASNTKVLGNINALLNDKHRTKIIEKLKGFDLDRVMDAQLWRIIVYFLKDETEYLNDLKSKLVSSSALWYSGIDGNTVSMGINPIEISSITAEATGYGGLHWKDEEILQMYNKLLSSLPDLQRHAGKNDLWSSFEILIGEMHWFLNFYRGILDSLDTFLETYTTVEELYGANVTYDSIEQGLISDKKDEVNHALSELSEMFYKGEASAGLVKLVINRVMLQTEPAVESALSYLSAWIRNKKGAAAFQDEKDSLLIILRRYKRSFPVLAEKSFTTEHLVKIAFALQAQGVQDEAIDYWETQGRESNYNNIKQFLVKQSEAV